MARLPQPGGDKGNWGDILNEFLLVSHEYDGSLKLIPQNKIQNLVTDLTDKANIADLGTAATSDIEDFATKSTQDTVDTGRLSEVNLTTQIKSYTPKQSAGTDQWHFDVVQGSNNGTKLPFTSRVVSATTGLPVLEQINAKPTTDTSEGVIDWQHNSTFGDLIHLTAGAGMTNTSNSAALIALGLDNGYPTGIFINNKGTATRGIGLKIAQNNTINVATDAYGFEVQQASPTSPAVHMFQQDSSATLMQLQAATSITSVNQELLRVIAAGATQGIIRAKTGSIYWQADIIQHDGGGFLNVASGLAADTNQTKQLSDGFGLRTFSGSAGIYYPARVSRNSAGIRLDVAPNTSGGPNWGLSTWQTGVTVSPGTTSPAVMLGTSAPATTATEGFPYMPSVSGTPTGVPTAKTGYSPFLYDTANNKLWVYNGSWKGVVLS